MESSDGYRRRKFLENELDKLQVFPEKTNEENYFVADRIYNYAFWDGYKYRESEELTELILTEPYNRVSKN